MNIIAEATEAATSEFSLFTGESALILWTAVLSMLTLAQVIATAAEIHILDKILKAVRALKVNRVRRVERKIEKAAHRHIVAAPAAIAEPPAVTTEAPRTEYAKNMSWIGHR